MDYMHLYGGRITFAYVPLFFSDVPEVDGVKDGTKCSGGRWGTQEEKLFRSGAGGGFDLKWHASHLRV